VVGTRALALSTSTTGAGCVVAPDVGTGGRAGAGAGPVVTPVGGTGARVGAGAWDGGAETLCDRSRMAALMGARVPSRAGQVGRVAARAWILPNWVVMVLS